MSQNTNFPALPPEQLAHLLTNEAVMNALYDRAKSMMWSMVQYKELQMLYSCALTFLYQGKTVSYSHLPDWAKSSE